MAGGEHSNTISPPLAVLTPTLAGQLRTGWLTSRLDLDAEPSVQPRVVTVNNQGTNPDLGKQVPYLRSNLWS